MKARHLIVLVAAALITISGVSLRPAPETPLEAFLTQTIVNFRHTHPAPKPSWEQQVANVFLPGLAAQGSPTSVQQSATRLDALTRCDSATGSGAQTLTLQNPGPGLADYIGLMIANGEATGTLTAANPIAITTSNINGTTPTLGTTQQTALTIGAVNGPGAISPVAPIKANTNSAPTMAGVSVTNMNWRFTACYYQAS